MDEKTSSMISMGVSEHELRPQCGNVIPEKDY